MHIHQDTHGILFHQSHARRRQRAICVTTIAMCRSTVLERARLALITHFFAFLSLLCVDPANSATSVVLSAVKVAASIYEQVVKADHSERRLHDD